MEILLSFFQREQVLNCLGTPFASTIYLKRDGIAITLKSNYKLLMKYLGGIAMLMRQNKTFPTLFDNRNRSTHRFSDLLDDIMEDAFTWSKGTFVPELNVYETDQEFEITLALPGMRKEDINISFENNALTIIGERKLEEEDGTKYHRIESRFGKFERSLPLPNGIDEENINANYENGVLTVTVPKSEETAGKKIEVH